MEGKWTKLGVVATVVGLGFGAVTIYKNPPDPTEEVRGLRDDIKRINQERADKEQKEREEQRVRDLERAERERKEKEAQRIRDFEKEIARLKGEIDYQTVSLRNDCDETIVVVVHYRALNNLWVTQGWWKVEPDELVRTGIATTNPIVYFYAKSDSYTWNGDDKEGALPKPVVSDGFMRIGTDYLEGKNLREVNLFKKHLGDEDEFKPMSFTCEGS